MFIDPLPSDTKSDFPWPDGFWAKLGMVAIMIICAAVVVLPMAYFFD